MGDKPPPPPPPNVSALPEPADAGGGSRLRHVEEKLGSKLGTQASGPPPSPLSNASELHPSLVPLNTAGIITGLIILDLVGCLSATK